MSRGIEPGDQAPDFELSNANAAVGEGTMALSDAMGYNCLLYTSDAADE